MLLDYLRNYNTIRNQVTIHILHNHRWERGSLKSLCMVMGDGEGVGLVMTDTNEFFLQISGFSLIYINVNNF